MNHIRLFAVKCRLFSQREALSQIPTTGDNLLASHVYGRELPHVLQQCLHPFSQGAALSFPSSVKVKLCPPEQAHTPVLAQTQQINLGTSTHAGGALLTNHEKLLTSHNVTYKHSEHPTESTQARQIDAFFS